MTTHNRDKIIAAAEEAGSSIVGGEDGTDTQCWTGDIAFTDETLEAFYTIAFEAGRVAEREECAKVCDEKWKRETNFDAYFCGKAIRARGESK